MIEVAGDVDSEVKQQTATNQRKEQIMPAQRPGSFTIDQAMEKLRQPTGD